MTPMLALSELSWYAALMASVTETLRAALEQCGATRYAVSKATGIPQSTLSRFVAEGRALRGDNIDKLAEHLGLELKARNTYRKRK